LWPPEELRVSDPQTFLFGIDSQLQEEMRIYGRKEFHIHLITRDEGGEIVRYSEQIRQ